MSRNRGIGLEALGIGSAVGVIAGGYKFAEFAHKAKKLSEVHEENQAFVSCATRAMADLREADRLLKIEEVRYALSRSPEKIAWIETAIKNAQHGVKNLVKHTRKVNEDVKGGTWGFGIRNRFRWVLDEHEKAIHARIELNSQHLTLLEVISFLGSLEPLACCEDNKRSDKRKEVDIDIRREHQPREAEFEQRREVRREVRYEGDREADFDRREIRREVHVDGTRDIHEQQEEENFRTLRGGVGPQPGQHTYVDEEGDIVTEGGQGNVTYRREYEVRDERPRGPPPGERVTYRREVRREEPHGPPERVTVRKEYRVEDERPRDYRGPWPPNSRL